MICSWHRYMWWPWTVVSFPERPVPTVAGGSQSTGLPSCLKRKLSGSGYWLFTVLWALTLRKIAAAVVKTNSFSRHQADISISFSPRWPRLRLPSVWVRWSHGQPLKICPLSQVCRKDHPHCDPISVKFIDFSLLCCAGYFFFLMPFWDWIKLNSSQGGSSGLGWTALQYHPWDHLGVNYAVTLLLLGAP